MKDHMSRAGAAELAKRIERYWHDKFKKTVRTVVEVVPGTEDMEPLYFVRSDMKDGRPA